MDCVLGILNLIEEKVLDFKRVSLVVKTHF